MRERLFPQRDVQQPQDYHVWANEYHSEMDLPGDGFTAPLSVETLRLPLPAAVCPMAHMVSHRHKYIFHTQGCEEVMCFVCCTSAHHIYEDSPPLFSVSVSLGRFPRQLAEKINVQKLIYCPLGCYHQLCPNTQTIFSFLF